MPRKTYKKGDVLYSISKVPVAGTSLTRTVVRKVEIVGIGKRIAILQWEGQTGFDRCSIKGLSAFAHKPGTPARRPSPLEYTTSADLAQPLAVCPSCGSTKFATHKKTCAHPLVLKRRSRK